jgi:hypothetical protein
VVNVALLRPYRSQLPGRGEKDESPTQVIVEVLAGRIFGRGRLRQYQVRVWTQGAVLTEWRMVDKVPAELANDDHRRQAGLA